MADIVKKFSDSSLKKERLPKRLRELINRKEKRRTAKKDPKTRKTESTNVKRDPLSVGANDIIFTDEDGNNYTATITGDFKDFDLETYEPVPGYYLDELVVVTITIGSSVQITSFPSIDGEPIFTDLENIVIPNENPNLELDQNGVLYNNRKTILLKSPVTNSGELVIPDTVVTIGNEAFAECSELTGTLTIPDSVQTIGLGAFAECTGFTGDLTIGNSVETIGDYAFVVCSGFTGDLTIPNSVQTIGDFAFEECTGFTGDLTIGNSVQTIGEGAFYECTGFGGTLTIPNSVQTIEFGAFAFCRFTSLTFEENSQLTTIGSLGLAIGEGSETFISAIKGTIEIPASVETIGAGAFSVGLTVLSCILKVRIWRSTAETLNITQGVGPFFGLFTTIEYIDDSVLRPGWNNVSREMYHNKLQLTSNVATDASISAAYYFDTENKVYTHIDTDVGDNTSISLPTSNTQAGLWLKIDTTSDNVYYSLKYDETRLTTLPQNVYDNEDLFNQWASENGFFINN